MRNRRKVRARQPLAALPASPSNTGTGTTASFSPDGSHNMQNAMPVFAGAGGPSGVPYNNPTYAPLSSAAAHSAPSPYIPPPGPLFSGQYSGAPEMSTSPVPFVPVPLPPQNLTSHIERALPSAQTRSTNANMMPLYGRGATSNESSASSLAATSHNTQPVIVPRSPYQPLATYNEDDEDAPPSSFSRETGSILRRSDATYTPSDIDGWRSTVGSPPPPSYRTGRD